ncbi:MAG TPA: SufE family protein [Rhizobiaceae bacterium]|nr:SufE family protein [Rhizobiaceae bacterium]
MTTDIAQIQEDFGFLDEWEDRYRYLIDLGRQLEPLPETARIEANKVKGCVSQVWLETLAGEGSDPQIRLRGDSDAHIVRGLVALMLAFYSGRRASDIVEADAETLLRSLGLEEHLTPQRANGLRSMIARIRNEAASRLEAASVS